MRNLISILACTILSVMHVNAQAIKTDFDKKVIMTDSLNLPSNIRAITILSILSELLERPSQSLVSNYDIQIEEMSVGSATDVALSQLQIVDIEKIEITESPISSYKKNGQGGSINLVLRSAGRNNKKVWGSIGSSLTKTTGLDPQFSIGYKNDRFMIRGILMGDTENRNSDSQTVVFNNNIFESNSVNEKEKKFKTQVASAFMQYELSKHDVLKLNVSETYTNSKEYETVDFNYPHTTTLKSSNTNIQAQIKYEHDDNVGKLIANLQYGYMPRSDDYLYPSHYDYTDELESHHLSGKLAYKLYLLNRVNDKGIRQNANLEVGSNFNVVYTDENTKLQDKLHSDYATEFVINPTDNSFYYMPYLSFDCSFGKLRLKSSFEFQRLKYDIKQSVTSFVDASNTITGKLMAEWHFSPHKNLRLILNRSLERPKNEQLYPYKYFSPKDVEYINGNSELTPMLTHEIAIDYIADYNWDSCNSLIINAGASINKVTDIINKVYPSKVPSNGGFGTILNYATFENSGSDIVGSANFMALYSYKSFSLSFTGNVYNKLQENDNKSNHHTYYNLSIFPHFKLKDGWHGGAQLTYSSKVDQADGTLGDCAIANIGVGKAWKNFFVYLTQTMPFDTRTKDIKVSGAKRTEKSYMMVENEVSLGFKYTF